MVSTQSPRRSKETQRERGFTANTHENEVSRAIIGAAIEVHQALGGPGLLESVYEEALAFELEQRGLAVERQKVVQVKYKDRTLSTPLRLDLVANGRVIVECKASSEHNSVFEAPVLTYLRVTGLKLGLVINFGERWLKDGVHRVVNGLYPDGGRGGPAAAR